MKTLILILVGFSCVLHAKSMGEFLREFRKEYDKKIELNAKANPNNIRLVSEARGFIGRTLNYDPSYRRLKFPKGDVPQSHGVCTDVIVRSFRGINLDLQSEIRNEIKEKGFNTYPNIWGLKRADPNIDHRRVPNLMTYFLGKAAALPRNGNWRGGDIVVWDTGGGTLHIGLISNKKSPADTPLAFHHFPGQPMLEEDVLHSWKVLAHFRWPKK